MVLSSSFKKYFQQAHASRIIKYETQVPTFFEFSKKNNLINV